MSEAEALDDLTLQIDSLQRHVIAGRLGDLTPEEWRDLGEDLARRAALCNGFGTVDGQPPVIVGDSDGA